MIHHKLKTSGICPGCGVNTGDFLAEWKQAGNPGGRAMHAAVREFLAPEVMGPGRICLWAPGEAAGIPVASDEAL